MDEKKNGNGAAPNETPEPAPANENATAAPAPSLEERLAAAEAQAAEMSEKALRALAEVENTRRRLERERDEARKYAASNFARDLLSPSDNLRRALASVPPGAVKDEVTRNLLAGVAATERELLAAFEKHGIKRIDPKGERFDHNFHQAIFEAENTGKPAGTIVEVLQPGYIQYDRLLRPAMVGVAKGPVAAAEPAKPAEAPLPAAPEERGQSEPPKPGDRVDTMA
ncbi:MAG TPA: nucleotide exchange factor GrpE [Stellaceae bacterium]|nr:nucleotide exchange factor GrpE [Stellaceae bacterium]